MNLTVHHHITIDFPALRAVGEILSKLDKVLTEQKTMNDALLKLQQEVSETRTVIGSAITLIGGLKKKLDEAIAANDPAALQALSDSLDADQAELAAAVAANTPAAPEPGTENPPAGGGPPEN